MKTLKTEQFQALDRLGALAMSTDTILNFLEEDTSKMLSHEEVMQRITTFFDEHIQIVIDEETRAEETAWVKVPTRSDFCSCLGIDLKTLERYLTDDYTQSLKGCKQGRVSPEDIPLIRKAIQVISGYYEGKLLSQPVGSIFALKNMLTSGWHDDQSLRLISDSRDKLEDYRRPTRSPEEIMQRFSSATLPKKPDFDE